VGEALLGAPGPVCDDGPSTSAGGAGLLRSQRRSGSARWRRLGLHVGNETVGEGEPIGEIALVATLVAAAVRGATAGCRQRPTACAERVDLRRKVRRLRVPRPLAFVLDASESMGIDARMAAAKGAVLSLLASAYTRRDRVALVTFSGEGADLVLAPTRSVALARRRLEHLPTGGATPLADGLREALRTIVNERVKDRALRPLVVVVSDGDANVPLRPGRRLDAELREQAELLCRAGARAAIIDTAPPGASSQLLQRLAAWLGGPYHRLETVRAAELVAIVDAD
jgi:magnesium chelatase subunit D